MSACKRIRLAIVPRAAAQGQPRHRNDRHGRPASTVDGREAASARAGTTAANIGSKPREQRANADGTSRERSLAVPPTRPRTGWLPTGTGAGAGRRGRPGPGVHPLHRRKPGGPGDGREHRRAAGWAGHRRRGDPARAVRHPRGQCPLLLQRRPRGRVTAGAHARRPDRRPACGPRTSRITSRSLRSARSRSGCRPAEAATGRPAAAPTPSPHRRRGRTGRRAK